MKPCISDLWALDATISILPIGGCRLWLMSRDLG